MKPLFSILCLLFCLTDLALADKTVIPHGDGQLRLYNYHLDEFREVSFRQKGRLIPKALQDIKHLLRSRDNGDTLPIDISLIDLIDHLQDHFGADTIEIISGYRRKEFNEALLKTGHKVSPVSLHMKGRALDIHIDEVREETLRDYLIGLRLGGVGYYGPFDFVHIDTGPVRRWGDSEYFPRKLIGVLQAKAPLQLLSNRNEYLAGKTLSFDWSFRPGDIHGLQLEHFFRGRWHSVAPAPKAAFDQSFQLPFDTKIFRSTDGSIRYGKYRWSFRTQHNPNLQSSNEFYLKKE